MPIPQPTPPRLPLSDALAALLWFDPTPAELDTLKALLDPYGEEPGRQFNTPEHGGTSQEHRRCGAGSILLRHAVFLTPEPVRPYFAVCALEAWRRIPVTQLAQWSRIPFPVLKRALGSRGLTPSGVATWNFTLHAAWLLDVVELPARSVAACMRLGRTAALGAILGARGVPFFGGQVPPGAFSSALNRYLAVLRAAFGG